MLKWNTQRGVAAIPKAQKPENFRANFEGFFDWALSDAQKVGSATQTASLDSCWTACCCGDPTSRLQASSHAQPASIQALRNSSLELRLRASSTRR